MEKINEQILKELKNLGITIDLTNISDIYAISVLEEKNSRRKKKVFRFFCRYEEKNLSKK